MEQDGIPGLAVGFRIEFGGSFEELMRMQKFMESTEFKAVTSANKIEASFDKLNIGGASVKMSSFSSETTAATREANRLEKQSEALVRQMTRQAEVFGKTASEIRQMNAAAKATRLDELGHTELAGRLRAASAEMDRLEASTGRVGARAKLSRNDMVNLGYQVNDIVVSLVSGQKPMMVFAQQGAQIGQIAAGAGVGIRGMAASIAALAVPFLPVIALLGVATAGFGLFVREMNKGVSTEQLTSDLGKITGGADATKQELYKLKDTSITWGDTMSALFSVVGEDIATAFVGDIKGMVGDIKGLLDDMAAYGKATLAGMYAAVAGTKAYIGEISKPGAVTNLLLMRDPTLLQRTYGAKFDEADKYLTGLGKRVQARAIQIRREANAATIGYNNLEKPKVDRTADRLARENAAIEAQIKGLYALATAYGVSGAAALVAEAQMKAESAAIRKKGDVDQFVAREIQLVVAQRTADTARAAFNLREQADVQAEVNTMVAQGLIPAARANDLIRDRIAELPILAAIEAAYQTKRVDDAKKAEEQLRKLREGFGARDAAAVGEWAAASSAAAKERIADLKAELDLVGATESVRIRALATIRATREAAAKGAPAGTQYSKDHIAEQVEIAELENQRQLRLDAFNDGLRYQADLLDILAGNASRAGQGLQEAFGQAGGALGDLTSRFASYMADQKRLDDLRKDGLAKAQEYARADQRAAAERRVNGLYDAKTMTARVGLYGDMAAAARGFFKEDSDGYRAATTALKVFRAVEFALSVRAIAQDAIETGSSIAKSGARAAANAVEAVAKAIASLPFPANIAAGAATVAALAAIGLSIAGSFGGKDTVEKPNEGRGTTLGDPEAQSASIKRAIDGLKEIDTVMLSTSRDMAASLRSIDTRIGGVAALIVRAGNVDASAGVAEGFKANAIGSILGNVPLVGGLLKSLFGTRTDVTGGGIYGGSQSLDSILSGGFDGQTYADVTKTKKFLGIVTGRSTSTQYGDLDSALEKQFTLILRSFNEAIRSAAGPLDVATTDIEQRLAGFVVNIGKIDTKGLTGEQIEEKLAAVFGAAADGMAAAAIPGIERFQKVGEGAFETLVRVASTVETVTASLDQMGAGVRALGIDAKLGIAAQFDTVRDFSSAADAYVERFYSDAEKNAAMAARFGKVFVSLGLTMPDTLAGFRALVEAQDLTTEAGQATYATLLKLAPAFADLKGAMDGAKSAADILSERQDLERKLLEVRGDTAAIRALDLAKLDVSNRQLQEQIWAIEAANQAAEDAKRLSEAWGTVGDSIMDEVKRIRGLNGVTEGGGFASLLGRFNAATLSARGGDQDAAKLLPGLSQELLRAAEQSATSRQELSRVQAQTAASLEETYAAIGKLSGAATAATSTQALLDAMANQQSATAAAAAANDSTTSELAALRAELAAMRGENTAGLAALKGDTGSMKKTLDNVTAESGGMAIRTEAA